MNFLDYTVFPSLSHYLLVNGLGVLLLALFAPNTEKSSYLCTVSFQVEHACLMTAAVKIEILFLLCLYYTVPASLSLLRVFHCLYPCNSLVHSPALRPSRLLHLPTRYLRENLLVFCSSALGLISVSLLFSYFHTASSSSWPLAVICCRVLSLFFLFLTRNTTRRSSQHHLDLGPASVGSPYPLPPSLSPLDLFQLILQATIPIPSVTIHFSLFTVDLLGVTSSL